MSETQTITVGSPNPQAIGELFDAVARWVEAGRPCFQCQECFETLKTDEEKAARFCTRHMQSKRNSLVELRKVTA